MKRVSITWLSALSSFACFAASNLFSVSPYVQHPDTNAMTIVFFTTENVKATVKVWRANEVDATSRRVR